MKRIFKFLPIALMGMLILTGCKKDGFVTFRATTQPYDGVGKMFVDNNYACWENGDQVKINSSTVTATVSTTSGGDGSYVELSGVAQAENYYAIYPASACASTFAPDAYITLPSVQQYRVVNGHQVLTAPMAAKAYDRAGDGSRVLRFQNLCLILKVHIEQKNNLIKAIKIVDSTGTVPLSGTGQVSFSAATPSVPSLTMTSPSYEVTLNMETAVSLNVSGGTDFYIAVPALPTGKTLWIHTKDMLNQTRKLAVTTHQALHSNTIVKVDGPTQVNNDAYEFPSWIQSVQSGYIDLGVKPEVGSKIEITFMVPDLTSSGISNNLTASQTVCGSRGLDNDDGINNKQWIAVGGQATYLDSGYSATVCQKPIRYTSRVTGQSRAYGKKYNVTVLSKKNASNKIYGETTFAILSPDGGSWHGETAASSYSSYNEHVNNIYVFGLGTAASDLHKGMRLYSFKYYTNNGTRLEHEFVPCQEKTGGRRIGVYDMKTGTFIVPTDATSPILPFTVGDD